MKFKLRPVMLQQPLLLLLLSFVLFSCQPAATAFRISYDPDHEPEPFSSSSSSSSFLRAFSLDDCRSLASNQHQQQQQQSPARLRETYRACLSLLFLNMPLRDTSRAAAHPPSSSSSSSSSGGHVQQGVAMTTDARFRGAASAASVAAAAAAAASAAMAGFRTDMMPPVLPLKRSGQFQFHNNQEEKETPTFGSALDQPDAVNDGDDDDEEAEQEGEEEEEEEEEEGLWRRINQRKRWSSSVAGKGVLRTRRQHSLSINSALVSLADMLMAQDFSRQRARQRAFRQQLLGLGR